MTLNWLHVFSKIFTTTDNTSRLPHFTLWELSAAMHIPTALPCHHKAVSHPDPHPAGADVPSQPQPRPQEVPDTGAGTGTAPGHPAACSQPHGASLQPSVPGEPSLHPSSFEPHSQDLWLFCCSQPSFSLHAGALVPTPAPARTAPSIAHSCSSSPTRVSALIFVITIYELSLLLHFFFPQGVSQSTKTPKPQSSSPCSQLDHYMLPTFPFPTAAAWGACASVICQFYCPSSFSSSFNSCSFFPSFSIICLLKWQ